ncbi:hypothetical protein [Chryseobacterium sp.]|uniref:hypothetical protein n=1 Tax=Chryseobacterium sp. TaxID=1871047 RepID=UPI0025C44910|nr:hypothetical protein [Chryseobacterium sp.]
MKNFIYFLFSVFITQSCYSPKTKVEKDKHPEIPEFPVFSDQAVAVKKVMELPISQKVNLSFLIKDEYFFIYNFPRMDSYKNNICQVFIIKDGKPIISEKWNNPQNMNHLAFIDDKGNLYADNRKYLFPDYRYKKILPFYDINVIHKKYEDSLHLGEPEKDSLVLKKIKNEQITFQKNILGKIHQMLVVPDEYSQENKNYAGYGSAYLCNPDQNNPFMLSYNIFKKIQDTTPEEGLKNTPEDIDSLYVQISSKIKMSLPENNFTQSPKKKNIDSTFFSIKDQIVSGNQWFSHGNHFVASFGYNPVHTYYYDVQWKGKTVFTKENQTEIIILNTLKTSTGKYFLTENIKEQKFQVYFLKE